MLHWNVKITKTFLHTRDVIQRSQRVHRNDEQLPVELKPEKEG